MVKDSNCHIWEDSNYHIWANTGTNLPAGFEEREHTGKGKKHKPWNAGTCQMQQDGFDHKLEKERRESANKHDRWNW